MRRERTTGGPNRAWALALVSVLALGGWLGTVAEPAAAAFPGRNGKIAFVSDGQVWTMKPDGTGRKQLTTNGGEMPAWSPDGRRLAFVRSTPTGGSEVFTMNADGSRQRNRSKNEFQDFQPDWSPDGRIVFVSSRTGNGDIYRMNADGSRQKNVSNNPARDTEPAWSPDGTKIAFVSRREGDDRQLHDEIYTMSPSGANQTNITKHPADDGDRSPTWSPDSKQIAFVSIRSSPGSPSFGFDVFAMPAAGGEPTNLTKSGGSFNPAWSPDGELIAFERNLQDDSDGEIYAMAATGGEQTNITDDGANDADPDWQPKPR